MNLKHLKTFFILLLSTLFFASVAFAVPPSDGTGDGETDGTVSDGTEDGTEEPGEYELQDDDIEAMDEAERTYGNDADQTTGLTTTILENADVDAGDNDCTEEFGETVQARAERTDGFWPGVNTYRIVPRIDENGEPYCDTEVIRYDRVNSCFDGETKILMGDKSLKPIKDILAGDIIWNPVLEKAQKVTHVLVGPEKLPMIEVSFNGNVMKITQTHPMVVLNDKASFENVSLNDIGSKDSKIVRANELKQGDSVLGADGAFHKLEGLRELPIDPAQQVYNFQVEAESDKITERMIVAEGFITGDVRVQANLNHYTLPWDKEAKKAQ